MQNSGRSQSVAAGRQGVPADFSYTSDPLRESRDIFAESPRECYINPYTGSSSHSEKGLEGPSPAKIYRALPSIPSPHQAPRTAIAVGALSPHTQGAIVGKAAGVWALLKSERREQNT